MSHALPTLTLLLPALLGVLLTACPAPEATPRELAEGCLVNTDCREPLVCAFRRCHNACKTDRDCPRGLHCRSADKPLNVCMLDDELVCPGGRDLECPAEMVCGPDLFCRNVCRSDRDCLADQACVQGVCANPVEVVDGGLPLNPQGIVRCVLNSDCSAPLVCRNGGCTRECRETRDCAPGAFCADAGVCANADSTPIASLTPGRADAGALADGYGEVCVVNSDCRNRSLRCLGGRCGVECFEAVDCNVGLNQCCTPFNRCASGPACIPPDAGLLDPPTPDGGCRNDADCQDSARCNGAERCIDRRCRAAEKTFCDDGNPCSLDMCAEVGPPCSYTSVRTDVDGDGRFPVACGGSADDCDDFDSNTYPGAPEKCDFKDNNCNGAIDEALWRVKPGSRGTIGTPGAYPPGVGKPQAVMHKGEIVVVAASDGVRGTLDAYTVDPTSFSPSSGPLAVGGSRTRWSQCGGTVGRRVGLPSLYSNGRQLLVTGLEATWPGTTCCAPGDREVRTAFFTLLDTPLATVDGGVVGQSQPSSAQSSCQSSAAFFTFNGALPARGASVSSNDDSWLLMWPDNAQTNTYPARALVARLSQGSLSAALHIWPSGALEPPAEMLQGFGDFRSDAHFGMAVLGDTVLLVWLNANSPANGKQVRLRHVLYDSSLSRALVEPRDLATPFSPPGVATVTSFNGRFVVATTSANNATGLVLHNIFTDGGMSGSRTLSLSQTAPNTNSFPGLFAGTQPGLALLDAGLLLVSSDTAAGVASDSLRFQWASHSPDASTQSLLVPVGRAVGEHTDFAVVPVTNRSSAVFWQDGDLQKVALECVDP